jgi:hypothetical protein
MNSPRKAAALIIETGVTAAILKNQPVTKTGMIKRAEISGR